MLENIIELMKVALLEKGFTNIDVFEEKCRSIEQLSQWLKLRVIQQKFAAQKQILILWQRRALTRVEKDISFLFFIYEKSQYTLYIIDNGEDITPSEIKQFSKDTLTYYVKYLKLPKTLSLDTKLPDSIINIALLEYAIWKKSINSINQTLYEIWQAEQFNITHINNRCACLKGILQTATTHQLFEFITLAHDFFLLKKRMINYQEENGEKVIVTKTQAGELFLEFKFKPLSLNTLFILKTSAVQFNDYRDNVVSFLKKCGTMSESSSGMYLNVTVEEHLTLTWQISFYSNDIRLVSNLSPTYFHKYLNLSYNLLDNILLSMTGGAIFQKASLQNHILKAESFIHSSYACARDLLLTSNLENYNLSISEIKSAYKVVDTKQKVQILLDKKEDSFLYLSYLDSAIPSGSLIIKTLGFFILDYNNQYKYYFIRSLVCECNIDEFPDIEQFSFPITNKTSHSDAIYFNSFLIMMKRLLEQYAALKRQVKNTGERLPPFSFLHHREHQVCLPQTIGKRSRETFEQQTLPYSISGSHLSLNKEKAIKNFYDKQYKASHKISCTYANLFGKRCYKAVRSNIESQIKSFPVILYLLKFFVENNDDLSIIACTESDIKISTELAYEFIIIRDKKTVTMRCIFQGKNCEQDMLPSIRLKWMLRKIMEIVFFPELFINTNICPINRFEYLCLEDKDLDYFTIEQEKLFQQNLKSLFDFSDGSFAFFNYFHTSMLFFAKWPSALNLYRIEDLSNDEENMPLSLIETDYTDIERASRIIIDFFGNDIIIGELISARDSVYFIPNSVLIESYISKFEKLIRAYSNLDIMGYSSRKDSPSSNVKKNIKKYKFIGNSGKDDTFFASVGAFLCCEVDKEEDRVLFRNLYLKVDKSSDGDDWGKFILIMISNFFDSVQLMSSFLDIEWALEARDILLYKALMLNGYSFLSRETTFNIPSYMQLPAKAKSARN